MQTLFFMSMGFELEEFNQLLIMLVSLNEHVSQRTVRMEHV